MDKTGSPSLDKLISGATAEQFQRKAEEGRRVMQKFNEGEPVPVSKPTDIQQLWHASRQMSADMPANPNRAIGAGVYASYGVQCASEPDLFLAAAMRCRLLSNLLERGVLNEYMRGEEPDTNLFVAASTIPFTKDDLAEVAMQKILTEAPEQLATQMQDEMRAHGYDPASPTIDSKFLRWLCENC